MKKYMTKMLCLLLCGLLLVGCASNGTENSETTAPEVSGAVGDSQGILDPNPNEADLTEAALAQIKALGTCPDDNYRTWYEIFVYSFCDSDGDGIGDFRGVISKLDYLQQMGITGIWLMPIHPSTSYHKYNVGDYYAIDPQYGTMDDFDAFLAECEKRDIHVILDLVVNHTGYDHQWFQNAMNYIKNLPEGAQPDVNECPYVDYYVFNQQGGSGYRIINGSKGWFYEGMFSPDMPDLNLSNEKVRAEITDIMKFWLDKGVAGFRLDAAKEFYSGTTDKNVEVLNWLQTTATSLKEDCYLVAEVWDTFQTITNFYASDITSIFNYAFGGVSGKIPEVLRGAGNSAKVNSYATALQKADAAYRGKNADYIDAPFLSNHDCGRIAGFTGRDENKTKLAAAMNVLMSGSCFIYYGEEIGMVSGGNNDPSLRAPMYWNVARDNGTTQKPPECTLPEEYPFGSLEEQINDDSSLYNYYRQVIAIRNSLPVIARGAITAETALNKDCISAQRKTWGEEECIILMNINTEAAQVDLSAYADWTMVASLSADGNAFAMEGTSLQLPAYGVAVLVPAK